MTISDAQSSEAAKTTSCGRAVEFPYGLEMPLAKAAHITDIARKIRKINQLVK